MQIVELKVEGFRTLKNVSWQPGNLNIVIGPNASGKSNLLKLLHLINKLSQGNLEDTINLSGGMASVLWNGQSRQINIRVQLGKETRDSNYTVNYTLRLSRVGNSSSYVVDIELMEYEEKIDANVEKNFPRLVTRSLLERREKNFSVRTEDTTEEMDLELFDASETLLSQLKSFPRKARYITVFAQTLNQFGVYQEFRRDDDANVRRSVISSFEEELDPDGQNLASVLHTVYESDVDFQENIDRAMTAAFGNDYKGLAFPPAGSQRVELGLRWKSLSRPQPAAVLSDGTLRFLFLITALSLPKLPSLICIDEPEAGLHPSMLPIIAEYAANAAERTQIVLTTHSVQFLDAFSEYNPTTTVAQLQDGETKLVTLDGEKLAYWLGKYSLGSLFNSGELENMAKDALDDESEEQEARNSNLSDEDAG
ncbi:MAG: AAA family ATPase [Capsulimonas sp.]|uniref:AAA family ATPase n=1 Tax=Capsulimonas sp. TaxID=2494211 RepID=UPI0032645E1D